MTAAFHFLTHSGAYSTDYGGIIPPPVTITGDIIVESVVPPPIATSGRILVLIDGKYEDVTAAVSGTQHYIIVEPGDYPTTENKRQKRVGSDRASD